MKIERQLSKIYRKSLLFADLTIWLFAVHELCKKFVIRGRFPRLSADFSLLRAKDTKRAKTMVPCYSRVWYLWDIVWTLHPRITRAVCIEISEWQNAPDNFIFLVVDSCKIAFAEG